MCLEKLEQTLLSLPLAIHKLLEIIKPALNSNFTLSAIGAAFGAFGGAYCLWQMNQKCEYEKSLSEINTLITLLATHTGTLLTFKQQHASPVNDEMKTIIDTLKNSNNCAENNTIKITASKLLLNLTHNKINTYGMIEILSKYAYKDSKALSLAIEIDAILLELSENITSRNKIIETIKNDPMPNKEKFPFYLGLTSINKSTNSILKDTTENILGYTNVALHFIDLLIPRIREIGKKCLPKKYAKKITNCKIADKYKDLIPEKDFIKGWDD